MIIEVEQSTINEIAINSTSTSSTIIFIKARTLGHKITRNSYNGRTNCITTIADSASTIAESYCDTASADDDVCTEVNNAIAGAGGDTSKVGSAMLCLLENRKVVNNTQCCDQDGTSNCVAL